MSRFLTKILNDKPGDKSEDKSKFEVIKKSDFELYNSSVTPPTPTPTPISPDKNYTKVANSIKPELFRGTSQKTYLALYRLTRGAVVPIRFIKITRNDLMAYADVSEVTLVKHITYLEKIAKLIKKTSIKGDNEGATYEIFIPEEIAIFRSTPPTPTPTPTSIQNLYSPYTKKLGVGGVGLVIENKHTYESPKTSLKTSTKNDDDDAYANGGFSVMIEKFTAAAKKLTGQNVTQKEAEEWGNLAELLILELEVAASRTERISSVPAFLTEVLRRQFFAVYRQQQSSNTSNKQAHPKKDKVGEGNIQSYEIKRLDEPGRAEALEQLREFAEDDFLLDFKKWYVEEDWDWLLANLRASDNK